MGEKSKGKIIGLMVLIAIISYSIGSFVGFRYGASKAQGVSVVEPNQSSGQLITGDRIPQGEYRVGKDIPAGEYKITDDKNGTYKLSKDSTGTKDSVIEYGVVHGQKYITTHDGEYLEIQFGYLEKVN